MKKPLILIVVTVALAFLFGCYMHNQKKDFQADDGTVKKRGTITYIDLEGGFFGIMAEDKNKYVPINLPKGFQRDGLKVIFEGVIRPDLAGIHMWGAYIELSTIKERHGL
jgi:hypothetical protein